MKKYVNLFIYISLIFLMIALYKADYLKVPVIHNYFAVVISVLLLFGGFVSNALQWKVILSGSGIKLPSSNAIVSVGLTIFGKYIPGKIWLVVGKAAYVSSMTGAPVSSISLVSLNNQFITLWVGLTLGFIGIMGIGGLHLWGWITFGFWLLLTLLIFSPIFHSTINKLVKLVIKKEVKLPYINFVNVLAILPVFFVTWLCWSAGIYFLVWGLSGEPTTLWNAFAFPLAGSLGIIAVISPGGLGVREGIMTGYFTLAGMDTTLAVTITVMARLWFLLGEIFIFLLSLILKKTTNCKKVTGENEKT